MSDTAKSALHKLRDALEAGADVPAVLPVTTGARDEQSVCFVATAPSARLAKLACCARLNGLKTTLLHLSGVPGWSPPLLDGFEQRHEVAGDDELLMALQSLRAGIVHVVSHTFSDSATTLAPLATDPLRTVVDFYDPLDHSVNPQRFETGHRHALEIRRIYRIQRYAYDRAGGVCTRLLWPRLTGTAGRPRCYFPEPLWEEQPPQAEKLHLRDGRLHVAYAGTLEPPPQPEPEFSGFQWLLRRAEQFGVHVHLHLRPAEAPERHLAYFEAARRSTHVDIEPHLEGRAYFDTLSGYDVGMLPTVASDRALEWDSNRALYPRGNWASKLTDYAEAGIYALCLPDHWAMARMLYHYAAGEAVERAQLLEPAYWQALKVRAHAFNGLGARRRQLTVAGRAPVLEGFYDTVRRRT